MKWKHVGRFQIMTVGLALSLVLLPGWRLARAEEPNYEKSDDFEKSKEEFGREKPPVDVRLGEKKEHHAKPAKERKTPAWLKGKTVGGWGGPTMNYLGLDLDVFEPLTEGRGLNEFHHDTWLIGGMGVGRIGPVRIGGMGFGDSQSQRKTVAGDERKATIDLAGGGGILELEGDLLPKVGLFGGAMLGGGNIRLSARGADLTDQEWDESETFFLAYPYGGLTVKVLPFMRLEATYGWLFFDYSPGGADYAPGPGVKAVDGSLSGAGTAQVRLLFGYETKLK
ncbi:MAG: hypothetical protein A2V67_16505 [Deltaproteobacteria bacterium RBG_13_61_14]|nr:MAG: hypothetical protein A2V67_16505 [Deltaproteobacteria bacterium RBG_13_61_14]